MVTKEEFEEKEDDQITIFKVENYLKSKRKIETALGSRLLAQFKMQLGGNHSSQFRPR